MIEKIRGRGRPPKLANYKTFIEQSKKQHPEWSATVIRNKLFEALCNKLQEKHPSWSYQQAEIFAEQRLPGKSSIQKFLNPENPKRKSQEPDIDIPWTLDKTPNLTADAIAAIFKVQNWAEAQNFESTYSNKGDIIRYGISVRQAYWIARLYKSISDTDFLWLASYVYAVYELSGELSATPQLNTWQLDRALRKGKEEFRLLGTNILESDWAFDAEFQLRMVEERVPLIEIKSWEELKNHAKEKLGQIQSKQKEVEN